MNIATLGFADSEARREALACLTRFVSALAGREGRVHCLAMTDLPLAKPLTADCDVLLEGVAEGLDAALPHTGVQAAERLLAEAGAEVVLLGSDDASLELAARLGARLGGCCVCGATMLEREGETLFVEKPAYGCSLTARFEIAAWPAVIALASCRVGEASAIDRECVHRAVRLEAVADEPWILEMAFEPSGGENPLPGAEVVVIGGRGVGGDAGFARLDGLARALGGQLGATRPAALAGWTGLERLVGQSGVAVRPRLALLFGVSGAAPFLAGLDAETVIAVNRDPDAPVFHGADVGVVTDWEEFAAELARLTG